MRYMEPILTVIIPVYNGEKYVRRAAESVMTQPEGNQLEVLLVNDGSTDGSGEVCNTLAREYPNIRVIHKENGGVSRARNQGIENACGKYVGFLDCDDWWEPDVFDRKLVEEFKLDSSMDIYQFAFREVNTSYTLEKCYPIAEKREYYDEPEFGRYNWSIPCCFIYRRDFLNNTGLRYPISKNGEDSPFVEMAMYYAKSYRSINRILLSYWENIDSCVHTTNVINTLKEQYKSLQQEQQFFMEKGVSFNGDIAWKIANVLPKLCADERFDTVDAFVREYCLAVLDQRPDERYCPELWCRVEGWRTNPRRVWLKYKITTGIPMRLISLCKLIPGINIVFNYFYTRFHRGFSPIGKR